MKHLIIDNSAKVIAASTPKKLGTASAFVTSIEHISHMVTEASVSSGILEPYQSLGINVIKANV